MTLSGGTLYGTTIDGGAYDDGEVFSVPLAGGTPTVLASFNGSTGQYPSAGLTLSADGSTLYGTTKQGGANGYGTVFSVPLAGGTPTVLASFDGSNLDGPSGVTLSGGTLYGTTAQGGANGYGAVFALTLAATPEPSTFALLAAGGIGLTVAAWRRRRGRCSHAAAASGEDDAPVLLSFRSPATQRTSAVRRAA